MKCQKIVAMISTASLFLYSLSPIKVYAEENKDPLKENIAQATYLLEEEIKGQYENVLKEIKEVIKEKGYDYPMTMKSYLDEGNPFRNLDYNGIIAAITAVNSIQGKDISKRVNADQIQFVSWEMEEDSYKDYGAVKVEEYTERSDGTYEKSGYHFTTQKETIGTYEEIDSTGYFKKTGETTITPSEIEKKYGCVTLKILKPEDIISQAGLKPVDLEDEIARRKDLLTKKISNETLRSNVFISVPKQAGGANEWVKKFVTAIGYEPGETVIIDRQKIATIASTLIGMIPYEWGGKAAHSGYDRTWWLYDETSCTQNGLDCSGFVQWVYMTAGFDSSITSRLISTNAILESGFQEVSEDELLPGDVGVVEHKTTNHCGIYAGDGKWYHCSSYNNTVVAEPYTFAKFYRVLPDEDEIELSVAINYVEPVMVAEATEGISAETSGENPEEGIPEQTADFVYTINEAEDYTEYPEDDVILLAKLITHEAENQGLNGWIAVGEVVKNRLRSIQFPGSVSDVIFQKGQFTKVSEIVSIEPRQEIIETARNVLSGTLTILGNSNVLFFRNAGGSTLDWGEYKYFTTIGEHQFYLGKEI